MLDNTSKMIKLLKEDIDTFTIGVFVKSNKKILSKRDLSNRLRAVPNILTVKPLIDDRLNNISKGDTEFNYFMIKFISSHESVKDDINYIRSYITNGQDDVNLDKITGILKLDFRVHTLEKG